jgi:hypothetical protein
MSDDTLFYIRDEGGTLLGVAKTRQEGLKKLEMSGKDGQVFPQPPDEPDQIVEKDSEDKGCPKTLIWVGEKWVPASITSQGMSSALHIETFYGSEAYASKRYLGDYVNPQRIFDTFLFDTFLDDEDTVPLSRVGFRSDDMRVSGERVILFSEFQKSKTKRPYRVGVQMNSQFRPDYFLETSNKHLALLSIITLDRVGLNFNLWLEACRHSFDFET